jgi:ribonuclease HII
MDAYKFDQFFSSRKFLEEPDALTGFSLITKSQKKHPLVLAGVDEAGRGPLAGPVVAAAVILPSFPRIRGLQDSKTLVEAKRDELYLEIKRTALACSVSIVEPAMIDDINIFQATMRAMRDAINSLKLHPDLVLIDGNQKPRSRFMEIAQVKGDGKSAAIMAASIVAKVTRDKIMLDLHKKYPHYGFNQHKGYGVPEHVEALREHGPCPFHRRTFEPVKSLLQEPAVSLF